MNIEAVLIAGPTAAGKSALAIALAEQLNGIVVNTDSMQVYRELPILTAQPSAQERSRVPHRLYGHVRVTEGYSAGRFLHESSAALTAARKDRRVAIFVGGTGLYFNVLTRGLSPIPQVPAAIRSAVRERFANLGRERFYADLIRRDPRSAALRVSDTSRILRAADVLDATGRALTEWQSVAGTPVLQGVRFVALVLAPERDLVNERIAQRFQSMTESGAIDEVRALLDLSPSLPASRILGFRELASYLRGEIALADALRLGQMETRRFAKRQLTWFRRYMADWRWLASGDPASVLASIAG